MIPIALNAFVSYAHADREIAGNLQRALEQVGLTSFLAHEDINVSEEWRLALLERLQLADLFICLLSARYMQSVWCLQESGIAAARERLTIIPISIDLTISQGFIGHIQTIRVEPDSVSPSMLIPALERGHSGPDLEFIINVVETSRSYRSAEQNLEPATRHVRRLSAAQAERLLRACRDNDQIHHAGLCARTYIPQIARVFPHALPEADMEFLRQTRARYHGGF